MIIEFIDAQRRCGHRIFAVCQVLGTLGVVFSATGYRKARTTSAGGEGVRRRGRGRGFVVDPPTRSEDPAATAGTVLRAAEDDALAAPEGLGCVALPG